VRLLQLLATSLLADLGAGKGTVRKAAAQESER
jgi:hypothetical protein